MSFKKPEFILAIFITLIIASYVELTFGGSGFLSLVFFFIAMILLIALIKMKSGRETKIQPSNKLIFVGISIIVVDLLYNLKTGSSIQTLDTMLILLGLSLIALNMRNSVIRRLGEFCIYMSSTFLLFFLILYAVPSQLGSDVYDYYGYYAITNPAIFLLESMNLSVHMDTLTTFHAYGIDVIYYKVDISCYGFYSMLLILSTVIAYRITTPTTTNRHSLLTVAIIMIFAAYVSNLLRILGLVYIGYFYGQETMMLFHSFIGWVLFALILLPLTYIYLR